MQHVHNLHLFRHVKNVSAFTLSRYSNDDAFFFHFIKIWIIRVSAAVSTLHKDKCNRAKKDDYFMVIYF